jgi:SAM-dependent methyltransferase
MKRKEHWDRVYSAKKPVELTWFQETPTTSLDLIRETGLGLDERVLDVGGGTSLLPSFLLEEGFQQLSVLDVSERALATAKAQLGQRAECVEWFEADLLTFQPPHQWALWHDRAVFHFLTSQEDRDAYCRVLGQGLEAGGHLVIATFAPDGPLKCSGLDCIRYSPESLHAVLGSEYQLRGSLEEAHQTPSGGTQSFVYSWFQRKEDT